MDDCGAVLIIDGDVEFRELLAALVREVGYLAKHAESGATGLAVARAERPSLVVLDTHLPDVSGYELCRELREELGEMLPIVFVSANRNEPNDRIAGILLGADEYFPKPPPHDEFLARVRRLLARTFVTASKAQSHLTPRELEVLALLAAGRQRVEIASELAISPKTVARHVEKIFSKLGVSSRAQAVALALRDGLLDDAA